MKEVLIVTFAAIAAVIDIKTRRIPNKLVLCMLGAWLLLTGYEISTGASSVLTSILDGATGLIIGGGIFLGVYLVSRKGLGGGDVKFTAIAGLYLGFGSTIPAILYGTILAALFGGILILAGKITRKDKMPLAPFLLAGIVITVLLP